MIRIHCRISLGLGLLLIPFLGDAQVTVTGPTCVTPGTVYQYLVAGQWDSSSTFRICVTGGTLVGQSDSCTGDQAPMPFVQVIWSNSAAGSLSLYSTKGNTQLQVNITAPLSGGSIADSSKNLTIGYDSIPPLIGCLPATGGACTPVYVYQWQISVDNIDWQDMEGATGLQLSVGYGLQKTSYCRRKVTDSASSTIAYSDAACILVTQPN